MSPKCLLLLSNRGSGLPQLSAKLRPSGGVAGGFQNSGFLAAITVRNGAREKRRRGARDSLIAIKTMGNPFPPKWFLFVSLSRLSVAKISGKVNAARAMGENDAKMGHP